MINEDERVKLNIRLKKLEGQVRGISVMLDDRRYCMDILNQTRAIISGMKKIEDIILTSHLNTCVVDSFHSDNREDQNEKIDEVINLISKYR